MARSSCDIGNPAYKPSPKEIDIHEDVATCEIWFAQGDRSEFLDIDFEWFETPDGIEVTAVKPDFDDRIIKPDDVKEDVMCGIRDVLHRAIHQFNWMK